MVVPTERGAGFMHRLAGIACGIVAGGGVLIAVAGMFRFSLGWIVAGAGLYVLGGALGERFRKGRAKR